MSTMSMPGFTAENSLYRTEGHFHTSVRGTSRVSDAEVTPQLICVLHGDNITCGGGEGGFGGGGGVAGGPAGPLPGPEGRDAVCRARCMRKRGAARSRCLAEC